MLELITKTLLPVWIFMFMYFNDFQCLCYIISRVLFVHFTNSSINISHFWSLNNFENNKNINLISVFMVHTLRKQKKKLPNIQMIQSLNKIKFHSMGTWNYSFRIMCRSFKGLVHKITTLYSEAKTIHTWIFVTNNFYDFPTLQRWCFLQKTNKTR